MKVLLFNVTHPRDDEKVWLVFLSVMLPFSPYRCKFLCWIRITGLRISISLIHQVCFNLKLRLFRRNSVNCWVLKNSTMCWISTWMRPISFAGWFHCMRLMNFQVERHTSYLSCIHFLKNKTKPRSSEMTTGSERSTNALCAISADSSNCTRSK